MNNLLRYSLALLLLLLFEKSSFSQIDTLFWFAAPEISSSVGDTPISLDFVSYSDPATITISQPANVGFTPIVVNIAANSFQSVDLTTYLSNIESPAADVVENTGIKISATANISASYGVYASNNRVTYALKGQKALGTDYYTPFQTDWDTKFTTPKSASTIDIVATEDNTTILISPRTNVIGHNANATFPIILNKGQTYSVRDTVVDVANNLSGSIISADKPIAVTLSNTALNTNLCASSVGDQITNSNYIGKDYIVQKGTTSNDIVYIMATQNATTIDMTNSLGTTSTLINWGETHKIALSSENLTYIHASKPVYVWHVRGFSCNISATQLPPLYCAGTYSTAFTRKASDSFGIMLYVRSGYEGDFSINGNNTLIPASAFTVVPGTSGEFVAATVYFSTSDIAISSYNIVKNTSDIFGLAVVSGGSGNGSSYAYFSDFTSSPFVNAGINDTVCANGSLALNGLVGGGSVTGVWTTNGFGSFQNSNTNLANTYMPSDLDSLITPIELYLSSTGPCEVKKDTLFLTVNPAPIVNANINQTVCANNANVQLEGNISGGAVTGTWTSLGGGTFSPSPDSLNATFIPSQTDITNGNVKLVLTSTNVGICQNVTDTMEVSFTNAANVTISVDTLEICSNNALVNISGTVTGNTTTGKWSTSGNGIFTPNNALLNTSYNSTQTDIDSGHVWLYLTSTNNGNCLQVKDSAFVKYTPIPTVNAGNNISVCSNDTAVTLNGTVGGPTLTGGWSGGFGTFSPDTASLNAIYNLSPTDVANGSVILTLTSTNNGNCLAVSDNLQINLVAPPMANFNFTEECAQTVAAYTDYSLDGGGTITNWNWNFGDGANSTIQNPTHSFNNAGNYSVQLIVSTALGCSDTVVKTVNSFVKPIAGFDYIASCNATNSIEIDFTDQSTISNGTINYWYYDFGGQGASAVQNPNQVFPTNGDYTVTHIVKSDHGCSDTIVKTIVVPSAPKAGFYFNTSNGLNVGASFNFIDTSSNAVNYYWTFGNNENSSIQNPSVIYMENGQYMVTQYVTGQYGCIDSASRLITINTVTKEITQLIPTAISPNGDGKNDIWKLEFIQSFYPKATVDIFNQWGQLLYSSVGYKKPWNGTYHGEFVPDGTYYYVINLNSGDKKNLYKGTLLVLKKGN